MKSEQMQAAADRVAARLDALDLDDDERQFLVAVLSAGASSVLPLDDEVAGYALGDIHFIPGGLSGLPGQPGPGQYADESPKESVSFHFGGLQISYSQQHP